MKIEDRLRRELHDTAEHLLVPPGDFDRVVRIGKRRRLMMAAGGTAASLVVVATVAILALLRTDGSDPVASSTPPPPPTTTTVPGPEPGLAPTTAVVASGPEGIVIHDLATPAETALQSDHWYETISWTVPDGAGGLVFVHELTPLPWDQGSIMWLPAGATEPRPLIAPGQGGLMVPIDMIDGTLTLVYRYDQAGGSELGALDLETGSTRRLIEPSEFVIDAAVDGDLLAVAYGGDCLRLEFYSLASGGPAEVGFSPETCLPSINAVGLAAGFLYTIEDSENGRELVVRSLQSGDRVDSVPVEGWDLSVAPDGIVAAGGETIRVGRFSEGSFESIGDFPGSSTVVLSGRLSIPEGATLGSGTGQIPCTPVDLPPLPDQGLPSVVAETRDAIFAAAAGCDVDTLSEMVIADQTSIAFEDQFTQTEPVRTWIQNARLGFNPFSWMVRILDTDPAFRESESGAYYAWPAVHITGSEEDWQKLSGVLSAEEFDQLHAFRDSGYMGFRIGIGADGRWWFAIAGD